MYLVRVARTADERARGLSHERTLPEGSGMLFVFPHDETGPFWNANTFVPLDLVYLDGTGYVLETKRMETILESGGALRTYPPRYPYRFALEVPRGTFPRQGQQQLWSAYHSPGILRVWTAPAHFTSLSV